MKRLAVSSLFAAVIGLVMLSVPSDIAAEDGVAVLGIGHSRTHSFGKVPFEKKPAISSNNTAIASVSWSGEESGTLIVTGVDEGTTVVTVKGNIRVLANGTLTVRPYTWSMTVKVVKSEKYTKLAIIYVGQKMSVTFPKHLRKATPVKNSNRDKVRVTSQTRMRVTFLGKEEGEAWLTFLLEVKLRDGTKKKVPGNILVRVLDKKPKKNEEHVTTGWDDLYIGEIIILNPGPDMDEHGKPKPKPKDKKVGMLEDWPSQDGVYASFQAAGRNYGVIGDLTIENATDEPVTVTVPPGLLLDSSDPNVQDLYVADVPTEQPVSGADEIDKPITIAPHTAYAIKDIPGFCPDAEKDPPAQETEGVSVYTVVKPDEKSAALLAAIAAVKNMDIGNLKLDVFSEDKARAMVSQGTLWQVDSRIDEEADNDFTSADLNARFFEAFSESAQGTLEKMDAASREKVERVVRDDIKRLVAATDFVTKQHTETEKVSGALH